MKKQRKNTATIIVFQTDIYNAMFQVLFQDALREKDVFLVVEHDHPTRIFCRALRKFWRKLYFFPFKRLIEQLYASFYLLPKKVKELHKEYEHIRILFHNAALIKPGYPECVFASMRRNGATFNLLYMDPVGRPYVAEHADFLRERNQFDKVFTFDYADAEKYGLEKCDTPYSKIYLPERAAQPCLYCLTAATERAYMTYKAFQYARENDVPFLFDLVCYGALKDFKGFFEDDPRAVFHDSFYPYQTVLQRVCESSCILDIARSDQSGLSLRPYEAVVYNKKLLTNNKSILLFQYYDPRYMQYFSDPAEIDWDWVKRNDPVDYGYRGEFSPLFLLEKLV